MSTYNFSSCKVNTSIKYKLSFSILQIADYKAPNFEAGGTMQQGMYIPKGNIMERLHLRCITIQIIFLLLLHVIILFSPKIYASFVYNLPL